MIAPREYLFRLQERGIKFGLSNIRHLLDAVGNPQLTYRTIHVAGTNGKGSVVAFVSSVLRKAGFTVGRYTSPHLIDFSERIVVNDAPIPDADLDRLILKFIPISEEMAEIDGLERPTYFEFGTAIAFEHFHEKQVDFAVVETGLGGRLDSTNVLEPEAIAITNIEVDHAQYLGDSISQIAFEKASIIKPEIPVVTAARQPEAIDVIKNRCRETGSDLFIDGADFSYTIEPDAFVLQRMTFTCSLGELRDLIVPLAGSYQGENAAVSVMICLALQQRFPEISEKTIRDGFAATKWPCRFELVRTDPPTIVDGAHNPSAAARLAEEIRKTFPDKQITLILAVSADKDARGIASVLVPLSRNVIVTQYGLPRSMRADKLREICGEFSDDCPVEPNLEAAMARAALSLSDNTMILIAGSLYLAGEASKLLSRK